MTSGATPNPKPDGTPRWQSHTLFAIAVATLLLTVVGTVALVKSCTQAEQDAGEGNIRVLPPLKHDSYLIPQSQLTLVADEAEEEECYEPMAPEWPTPVDLEIDRGRPCLIRKAVYTYSCRFKTPHRDYLTAAVICLPLNFYNRERPGARNYPLTFRRPIVAEKGDYVNVEVAVIDPKQVGWSYKGTLKVYYNDNKLAVAENVIVDILAEKPLPSKERYEKEAKRANRR